MGNGPRARFDKTVNRQFFCCGQPRLLFCVFRRNTRPPAHKLAMPVPLDVLVLRILCPSLRALDS